MNKLKVILKKHSGRDATGQVMVRHVGGRHKRFYRIIDFKRNKLDMVGTISAIEYDPNRTVDIALVQYKDGEKRYILAPVGLKVGDSVASGERVEVKTGNALPLLNIPIGSLIHNVELTKGRGGQMVRSAGNQAIVMAREEGYVHVKMPSGEVRRILGGNYATIGQLGNVEWKDNVIGKAGNNRRRGKRPVVRGVAMNPRSHPHGGGEGRSGIGMPTPKTYAGKLAYGKTRSKKKYSDKYIIKRRGTK
jgi:large subunit ribosomal protein L2